MKQLKLNQKSAQQILADDILSFFDIQEYKTITQFALQDIDLSDDVSASKTSIDLQNYPYMVQPLSKLAIEEGKRKEICIAFPQQCGKTLLQTCCLLYNITYNSLQAITVYPSMDLSVETGMTKIIPLIKKIPQFAEEIEKPFAIRSDRIKLSNCIAYFLGNGSKIVSRSCKLVLGDECSIWDTPNGVNNIEEMKKRTRSYNECLQLFVSTPRYKQDHFWRQFLQGSQGYYYLRCQHCNQLTMRSADINNLQFESVYNEDLKQYVVVRGSERMICPACKHEHTEADRQKMIKQGAYIHKFPDRVALNPSYQCGVLASLLNVHSWSAISDATLSQGKQAELQDFISYDNSIRGLPFQQRNYNKQDETAISQHFFNPDELKKQDIEAIFIAADTQDTFSVLAVVAYTRQDNLYVLEVARPRFLWLDDEQRKVINAENQRNGKQPEKTVLDYINGTYYGIKPIMALIDMRGHRADEIKNFSRLQKNILMYAGTNLKFDKWKVSENNPKLFLCDARKFQADLIFKLYFQQNRQTNYLYLPKTLTDIDIEEITSFQPDNEKRNGGQYENWSCADRVHDCFDTVKMAICAVNISARIYRKDRFLHGQARILNQTINKPKRASNAKRQTVARKPVFRT